MWANETAVLARWIVCEKSGIWAAAVRWADRHDAVPLRETRSLLDCREELARWPGSFVVLEATEGNGEGVLRLVWEMNDAFPRATAVVVTTALAEPCGDWFREAGAIDVVAALRCAGRLVRCARRHFSTLPRRRQSVRERVWARLPWPER